MINLRSSLFVLSLAAVVFALPVAAPASPAESGDQAPPAAVKTDAPDDAKAPEQSDAAQDAQTSAPQKGTPGDAPAEASVAAAPPQADIEQLRDFEGIGLYNRSSAMSLGDDFWNKTDRSALMAMYRQMPAVSEIPAIQQLIRRTLLTQADPKGINNDITIAPGEDLLTLRLEKLLEGGLYDEARALYVSLKDDPYDDRLIRAGMLATLFSGEKGLVCIDSQTFKDGAVPQSFVHVMSAYCEASAADTPPPDAIATLENSNLKMLKTLALQKDLKIPYKSEEFSKLSLIEQAVIVAEKRLDLSSLNAQTIKALPPSHLPFLIGARDSLDLVQLSLMARAITWGYPYHDALKTAYISALPPASGGSGKAKADTTVEKIAIMYADATNADNDSQSWAAIESAMSFTKSFGPGAMAPFSDAIADIAPPQGLSPATVVQVYEIFLVSGQRIPYSWASYKLDQNQANASDPATLQQTAAAFFMQGSQNDKEKIAEQLQALIEKSDKRSEFFLDNIIENVDNSGPTIHNPVKIYEKEFNLTFRQDYVMPSMRTWKRLLDAGENRDVTGTALLSTILLQDQSIKDVYPGLLSGVLNSLEYVGLTDVSTELAVYASLRNIK